jgi:isopentenyl-diphosphate delta-isomerase
MIVTGECTSYCVRDVAPSTPILGNIGGVQAVKMKSRDVERMLGRVGASALCVHLNPAQEFVQPGGDRDFRGVLAAIERLAADLPVPVIVKETGCGLSRSVGERLLRCGVRHVDVSGAGGTSWVAVETMRANDPALRTVGEAFREWGIPTALSVAALAPLGFETLIATGGIASGLDAARALRLGATAVGIARPVLRALAAGGTDAVHRFFDGVEEEIRGVCFLTGSRTLAELRRAPARFLGELSNVR